MFDELNEWLSKLYGMDRIGRKGVQVVLEWMDLVKRLVGGEMPAVFCPAPRQGRWVKMTIKPEGVAGDDELVSLADAACAQTRRWYAADHGTAADHQLVVDAMTLSFRLAETEAKR